MECISYKKDYKYQIVESYAVKIPITPEADISSPSDFITLTSSGLLTVKKGYAWDGPSGPTIDTPNFMRASLVHDALYQLMREELLGNDSTRKPADRLLYKMCREDGMSLIRACWVRIGVRICGRPYSDPSKKKQVIKAPKKCKEST